MFNNESLSATPLGDIEIAFNGDIDWDNSTLDVSFIGSDDMKIVSASNWGSGGINGN